MTLRARGHCFLLLIGLGIALRLRWAGRVDVADLGPSPDAVHYETAAVNLARGRGYVLDLDGAIYPPLYPPGFSSIMALGVPMTGSRPGFGIHTVQVFAAVSIAVAWLLAFRIAGPWGGAAAATILATSNTHVAQSWRVMSDIPSAGLCAVVGAWALATLRRRSSSTEAFLLGLSAGALAIVRTSNVVALPPMLVVILLEKDRRRDVSWLASLAAGSALGFFVLLLDQWMRFGSPFINGYSYWPLNKPPADWFSFANYLGPSQSPEPNGPANLWRYLSSLAGDGSLWTWPIGGLFAAGLIATLRSEDRDARRLGCFTAVFIAAELVLFGAYRFQAVRFLLPATSFAAAVAGAPIGLRSMRRARPIGLALLVLGAVSSLRPWGASLDVGRTWRRASVSGALAIIDRKAPRDSIVFAPGDPLLADRLLDMEHSDRLLVSLGNTRFRGVQEPEGRLRPLRRLPSRGWMLRSIAEPADRVATGAVLAEALGTGRPVYLAEPEPTRPWTGLRDGRPAKELADFDFREAGRVPGAVVYRVTRRTSVPAAPPDSAAP